MRSATGIVVGVLITGLVFSAGVGATTDLEAPEVEETSLSTAADPIDIEETKEELYSTLPPGTSETINALGDQGCEFGLKVLNDQGWYLPPERDAYGYEYDILSGPCKDFRDTLEHRVLNGGDPPYLQYCHSMYGVNCVAVGHYACDFALIVGSGMVYYCLGGITPYN